MSDIEDDDGEWTDIEENEQNETNDGDDVPVPSFYEDEQVEK